MHRLAIIVLALVPALALAVDKPNKWPHAMRQTYADGTWTEVAIAQCDEDDCDYVFRISNADASTPYPFSLRGHPYSIHMSGGYGYWPGENGAFSFSVPVACDKADHAFVGVAEDHLLECRATFVGVAGKAVLEGIDILGDGAPQRRLLPATGAVPAGDGA